jgi:hypothetical protein
MPPFEDDATLFPVRLADELVPLPHKWGPDYQRLRIQFTADVFLSILGAKRGFDRIHFVQLG